MPSMAIPKNKGVSSFFIRPQKRLMQIFVQFKGSQESRKAIMDCITSAGAELLSVEMSFGSDGKNEINAFAEVVNSELKSGHLKRMVESIPSTTLCMVNESTNGILVDSISFPLVLSNGDRIMLVRCDSMSSMISKLRAQFSTGSDVILYHEGVALGKRGAGEFVKRLGKDYVREHFQDFIAILTTFGYGQIEVVKHKPVIILRVKDNFECQNNVSEKPYSNFVRGNLCGYVSTLLGQEMQCSETSCIAMGSRACEFSLSAA